MQGKAVQFYNLDLHLTGFVSLKKHTAILAFYSAHSIEYTHQEKS